MTDIVERLRSVVNLQGSTYSSAEVLGMLSQAAGEIERLRDLSDKRADQLSGSYFVQSQLNAEIERLRGALSAAGQRGGSA